MMWVKNLMSTFHARHGFQFGPTGTDGVDPVERRGGKYGS